MKRESFLNSHLRSVLLALATTFTLVAFMSGHPLLTNSASADPAPKIQICHIPSGSPAVRQFGNPANWHTITISERALSAHLKHGDLPGACGGHAV